MQCESLNNNNIYELTCVRFFFFFSVSKFNAKDHTFLGFYFFHTFAKQNCCSAISTGCEMYFLHWKVKHKYCIAYVSVTK